MMDIDLDDLCSLEMNYLHPQTKLNCSTTHSDKHELLCIIDHDEPYNYHEEDGLHWISEATPYEVEPDYSDEVEPVKSPKKASKMTKPKKVKKNSNAIKKMGRIILKRLKDYQIENNINTGVENMVRMLE